MYAVWHHYRQAFPEKGPFVEALSGWLLGEPSRDKSQMKGAIKKFGLMDRLEISEDEAKSAAEHLYTRHFDLPDWYVKHYNNKHGKKSHGYDGNEKKAQ